MLRADKERVVTELAERLEGADSLIVADYRGLTNAQLEAVRSKLRGHGATFIVVKNTLTRRAAEAAGAESLLALLEGPTAIAFVAAGGDPVGVAKTLAETAKDTKILSLRGGVLSGKPMEAADVEELAKLPPEDVLKSQLVGVIVAPLTQLLGLLEAPVRDLVGLVDARIEQLGGFVADTAAEDAQASSASPGDEPPAAPAEAQAEAADEETRVEAAGDEPAAAAEGGDGTTENETSQEEQD